MGRLCCKLYCCKVKFRIGERHCEQWVHYINGRATKLLPRV